MRASLALIALLVSLSAWAGSEPRRIVLIGGASSEGRGRHDYPAGIRLMKAYLESSADVRSIGGVVIDAWPDGWPADPAAFDRAATVVWYFDGVERHPLLDAGRRAQVERLMQAGVGLVALHQAITLPAGDRSVGLEHWLGGVRDGMYDRATEMVEFRPAAHTASRGVAAFSYRDEFYPTIRFVDNGRLVPVLEGRLHPEFRDGKFQVIGRGERATVAWAFERDGGGRAFGFSGAHYLAAFDDPALRRLILNAILWTARIDVPAGGVDSGPEGAAQAAVAAPRERRVTEAVITRSTDDQIVEFPWGRLTWYASGALGNSDTLTVGIAQIRPGEGNPLHYHPNCDEVLRVLQGRILQRIGDRTVEMGVGDTASIPTGMRHQAQNIGSEDAVLLVSFSSADRRTVNE